MNGRTGRSGKWSLLSDLAIIIAINVQMCVAACIAAQALAAPAIAQPALQF